MKIKYRERIPCLVSRGTCCRRGCRRRALCVCVCVFVFSWSCRRRGTTTTTRTSSSSWRASNADVLDSMLEFPSPKISGGSGVVSALSAQSNAVLYDTPLWPEMVTALLVTIISSHSVLRVQGGGGEYLQKREEVERRRIKRNPSIILIQ